MTALAVLRLPGLSCFSMFVFGCAAEWPSRELLEARDAYREAEVSRAASLGTVAAVASSAAGMLSTFGVIAAIV